MAAEVELFDDLDAVARDAAGALDRAATPCLFDRFDWYRMTLAHCPVAGRPLVARAVDGADRAWLFLVAQGGQARALASWYTLSYGPILRGGRDTLLRELARRLRRAGIATVSLAPMPEPQPLAPAFAAAGWRVRVTAATVNWQVVTAGQDFAAYWAGRPGRLRETVRRRSREGRLKIAIHKHFDASAWAEYEDVYRRSWKPAEGSSAFLRALAEQEGAAGTLRLGVARHDGAAVAAQLWLVEGGVATIHKLAHVEEARRLSPGTVLSAAMFREVIDRDRPELIDFGTGDDPYKADWMDTRRTLWRLDAYDLRAPQGLAAAARAAAGSLVRRLRSD